MTESTNPPQVLFQLEKLYIKDSSYESPNAPHVFLGSQAPEVGVQLGISHQPIDPQQGLYESVLAVTVTAKQGDKNVFLAEAQQAGLFRLQGLPESEIAKALEIAAPNVLLPFARQAINALVEAGGFPQLLISPVNFEALYLQKQQQQQSAPASSH